MPMRQETVTTTVARQHVEYNALRASLLVRNVSTNPIFVSENPTGVTTEGYELFENEFISFAYRDGDEPELALYFQSTGGDATLMIIEKFGPRIGGE